MVSGTNSARQQDNILNIRIGSVSEEEELAAHVAAYARALEEAGVRELNLHRHLVSQYSDMCCQRIFKRTTSTE